MFKVYALALLVVSATAFSIDLEKKELPVQGSPVGEILYTTDVNFGSRASPQRLSTVFDITSQNTWVVDPAQCKDCTKEAPNVKTFNCENDQTCKASDKLGGSAFGFAGELQFTSHADGPKKNVYREATDVYTVADKQFNNMDIILPQGVLPQPRDTAFVNYFSKAQASIGLGSSYAAFMQGLNNSKHSQVKVDSKQYSLYLGATNKLVFGEPEGFFKSDDFHTFRNTKNVNQGILKDSYALKANSVKVGEALIPLSISAATDAQPRTQDTYGVFSSTSKFINFQDAGVLKSIVDQINKQSNNQANCVEVTNKKYYYQCDSVDQLPTLELELTDGHSTTKSYFFDPKDYTEPINVEGGVAKHLLLLRKGLTGYENFQLSAFSAPGSNQFVWLGYPFFNKYYVNFDYDKNDIQIAHKYNFEPQAKNLDSNNRLLFLIIGGIATLALVGYLLSSLGDVPYNPETMKVNMADIHSTPSKQVILTNQSQGSPLRYIAQASNKYELRPAQTLSNFVSVPQKATYFPAVVKSQRSPGRYQIQ